MRKSIFVISDLHLGGAPGFQICPPANQKRLAEFIRWTTTQQYSEVEVHLVLAGDIVDFLAEEKFKVFTDSDDEAAAKLQNIFEATHEVWDALASFVKSGGFLTLMLGNHDIELSFPGPRKLLLDRLGPGQVDFIYDNQAFTLGPLLVEHGNSFDGWNAVHHDYLRQVRSSLSRKETPIKVPEIPGSKMVIEVMNGLKAQYRFVDLLKPETSAVVPLLAVLNPAVFEKLQKVWTFYRQSKKVKYDRQGIPGNRSLISADLDDGMSGSGLEETEDEFTATSTPSFSQSEARILQEARALAGLSIDPDEAGEISMLETVGAFWDLWRASTGDKTKQIDRLARALRVLAKDEHLAFDHGFEDENYLQAARTLAKRGFQVVVFGHTHLVKRVPLKEINPHALYFNSGTWADLIRLPQSLFEPDEAKAIEELTGFANDLTNNHLENWRYQKPTFIRVDIAGDTLQQADAYLFHNSNHIEQVV